MTKTAVIVGASFAGLGVAHRLLKWARSPSQDVKVILISPTTHLYWNMASIRAVVPCTIPDEKLGVPLAEGLSRYPPENFEFILGTATALDVGHKTITVSLASDDNTRDISYDALVIATGARPLDPSMPWKAHGPHEATISRLRAVRERISGATSIVVAGAGPTGVELAGELAYAFGDSKKVTLLARGPQILHDDYIADNVERKLVGLGVEVRGNAWVKETREITSTDTGDEGEPTSPATRQLETPSQVEVVYESHGQGGGEQTILCDLYLPTMGLRPNTEWLGPELLTDKGNLCVDEYFRVQGTEGAFGVGDVVSVPRASILLTDCHAPQVARNVQLYLQHDKSGDINFCPIRNTSADILFTATGPRRGAGRIGWYQVPSLVVYQAKAKTLGVEKAQSYVDGSRWRWK